VDDRNRSGKAERFVVDNADVGAVSRDRGDRVLADGCIARFTAVAGQRVSLEERSNVPAGQVGKADVQPIGKNQPFPDGNQATSKPPSS
jgi:hypothetical protein